MNQELLPTDDDVRFFRENGYWLGPKVIGDDEIDELREHMDRVYDCRYETGQPPWSCSWKPGDDPAALRKMDNAHWADLTIRKLATNETIGAMAARLIGADGIRLWHDQLLYKAGGGKPSGNVGWHQDYYYWQCSDRPEMLTAWVALDDVTVENGAMLVVPRSHQWGMMKESDFFNTDIENLEKSIAMPEGEVFTKVPCVLPKGHLSFHHSLTIHGSGPNMTDRPRRSLVVHMMSDSCRFRANSPSAGHMNALLFHGGDGEPFANDYLPRIYPPEG